MSRTTVAVCSLLVLLAGIGLADVRTEMLMRTSMPAGMGTMEGTTTTEYQGDKRAETGTMKFVGGIMGTFAGGPQNQDEITRLDKEVIWDLDSKTKSYSEKPLSDLGKTAPGMQGKSESHGNAPNQHYHITKADIKVTKTGAEKTINSFPCKEYVITYDMVIEDSAGKQSVEQVMTMDLWATPLTDDLRKAQAAQTAFSQKLAQKEGMDLAPDQAQQMGMGSLTAAYGLDSKQTAEKMADVNREMQKVDGYPIVTDVKWQMKTDTLSGGAAQTQAPPQEQPASQPSGLGGMLAAAMGGNKPASQPAQSGPPILFSSYMELKSVSTSDVAADHFEVPSDYKLVKGK